MNDSKNKVALKVTLKTEPRNWWWYEESIL